MAKITAQSDYRKLVCEILALYENAKKSLALFYWKTGQRIVEVEQKGVARAAHGSAFLEVLSADLTRQCGGGTGFSAENLRRMRRFYLTHLKQSAPTDLTWTQYVELLPVKDERTRAHLEQRAVQEGLGSREIRRLVRQTKAGATCAAAPVAKTIFLKALPPLKCPNGLQLHTYQKVTGKAASVYKAEEGLVLLDCGFFVCHAVTKEEASRVTVTEKPAYTYAAAVERVVDGDTLLVVIALGFQIAVREKLRLRGINTPELGTPEGEKAKRYVAGLLPAGSPIILKSHQTDIYGRFVADVFYKTGASAAESSLTGGTYLNQQLLDEGYAVRAQ